MRRLICVTLSESAYAQIVRRDGNESGTLTLASPLEFENTLLGPIELVLSQELDTHATHGGFRLRVLKCGYRIVVAEGPRDKRAALLRWEYARELNEGDDWPQHHLHVHSSLAGADITGIHIPTGPVLIEYVIRFMISELGVTPARPDWRNSLDESEELFHKEFRPPGRWGRSARDKRA